MAITQAHRLVGLTFLLMQGTQSNAEPADHYRSFVDPVNTQKPRLLVGRVSPQVIPVRVGVQPIFLIGRDALSIRWLEKHLIALRRVNAIGYVVDPISQTLLEQLRHSSGFTPLFYLPNSEALMVEFGLSHYPVFIDSARGLITQ